MMSNFIIYLAGYISGKKLKECIEWRKYLRTYYASKGWSIVWLDPLKGLTARDIEPHAIVHRDYNSVKKANLIVANLNTFGQERPSVGTFCELAWAWEQKKPIVIITEKEYYIKHPFINYFASWIVKNVEEVVGKKIIPYFYKGTVTAKY